jgi:aspartate/methionine/tyrosine aminotransferase
MLNPLVFELSDYPFDRLRALIGETIKASDGLWDRYPPIDGTPEFRAAVADWLTRCFSLESDFIDRDQQILPVLGTREALYLAAIMAVDTSPGRPVPQSTLSCLFRGGGDIRG